MIGTSVRTGRQPTHPARAGGPAATASLAPRLCELKPRPVQSEAAEGAADNEFDPTPWFNLDEVSLIAARTVRHERTAAAAALEEAQRQHETALATQLAELLAAAERAHQEALASLRDLAGSLLAATLDEIRATILALPPAASLGPVLDRVIGGAAGLTVTVEARADRLPAIAALLGPMLEARGTTLVATVADLPPGKMRLAWDDRWVAIDLGAHLADLKATLLADLAQPSPPEQDP